MCLVFPLPDNVAITLRPDGFPCKAAVRPVGRHSWPSAQIKVCLGEREGAEGGGAHGADPSVGGVQWSWVGRPRGEWFPC